MADMVVETGAGLSTANSYVSVDDADIYHEKRLHITDWSSSTGSTKEAALMWATSLLDRMVDWDGTKYTSTQALRWPRSGIYDVDGYSIDSDTIPQFLKDATAEYARLLIATDLTAVNDLAGFSEIKVDVIQLKIDKWDRTKTLPDPVWNMVKNYGKRMSTQQRATERM